MLFCSNSPLTSNSALVAWWYFLVLFLPLSTTAHWWCVAYWLVDAFWCFSSPCQQQGFGGSGQFGVFFTCPHTTLQIVWLGPLCCFFLAFWCFSPTCHHKNFSDLVLFSYFTSKHADTTFYKVRGVTDHSYTLSNPPLKLYSGDCHVQITLTGLS